MSEYIGGVVNVVTGEGWMFERPSEEEYKKLMKEIDNNVSNYYKKYYENTNTIPILGPNAEKNVDIFK